MVWASERLLQLTNIKRIVCSTVREGLNDIQTEINVLKPGENGIWIKFNDFIFISDPEELNEIIRES